MPKQKGQKLTLSLTSCGRDFFSIYELEVLINGKPYTYPINSEFAVRQIKALIKRKRFGTALKVLNAFILPGFNSFKGEE